ncbi:MAG: NAD+ synthase [Promethearchaeota archaeon]
MRKLNYVKLIDDIANWIREYVLSANCQGIVVGISGGIDSAVTTALYVKALGIKKILGVGLPCESNPQDLEDSKLVANHLEIPYHVIDLTQTYQKFLESFPDEIKKDPMALANIKPRLRMTTLYYLAQSLGYLVGGTGNKTEILIGYFTKYGDGGVDIEPMGELYKCEVRELARLLNIPEKIIIKPPSAGLWKGQTDEGEIGITYDELDEILYRIEYGFDLDDFNQENVEKVKKMMKNSRHKRNLPPTFKIKKVSV